jgi:hypothetical protein
MKTLDAFENTKDHSGHRFDAIAFRRRGVRAGATFPGEDERIA